MLENPIISIFEDRKHDKCSRKSAEYILQMLVGSKNTFFKAEHIKLSNYILDFIKKEDSDTLNYFREATEYTLSCHWNDSFCQNQSDDDMNFFFIEILFVYLSRQVNEILRNDYFNQFTNLEILEECFLTYKFSKTSDESIEPNTKVY